VRTEEILRHEAEYRAIREALGEYDVTLVLAQTCSQARLEAGEMAEQQDHVGWQSDVPDASHPPG
jgi:hypothetical protein